MPPSAAAAKPVKRAAKKPAGPTAVQLLATLTATSRAREAELTEVVERLSRTVASCKALIADQQAALTSTFSVGEVAMRLELGAARARVRELEISAASGREAHATVEAMRDDRARLLQLMADAATARDEDTRAHAKALAEVRAESDTLRERLEVTFRVRQWGAGCRSRHGAVARCCAGTVV